MAPLEELNEMFGEVPGCELVTPEQYERHFARFWPNYRPHVNFDNVPPCQQELIKKIDPEYVARWNEHEALRAEIETEL